jgi:3D (Asp-Asp-Asp) domain-containing protein
VAANFLPIGTRVRIPELYGSQVFYVEDRMNERYHYKMDIWMKEKAAAKQFGVKYTTIEVF